MQGEEISVVSFKNTVSKDVNIPQFWVSNVSYGGESVARFYGDTQAQAKSKGDAYISSQSRGKQVIPGGGGNTYNTLDEVFRAFNECKLSFREAEVEMKRINPSLSPNDIQDMLVNDNPTPPDCGGSSGTSDDDGSWSLWPLTDENRFMLIGVLTIYLLYRYGRD
jgi:hypothetical protein